MRMCSYGVRVVDGDGDYRDAGVRIGRWGCLQHLCAADWDFVESGDCGWVGVVENRYPEGIIHSPPSEANL